MSKKYSYRGEINNGFEQENPTYVNQNGKHHLQIGELSKQYLDRQKQLDDLQANAFQRFFRRNEYIFKLLFYTAIHAIILAYFAYATYYFIDAEENGASPQGFFNNSTLKRLSPINDVATTTTQAPPPPKEEFKRCKGKCGFQWCDGYGMLLILTVLAYFGLFYYFIFKPTCGKWIQKNIFKKINNVLLMRLCMFTVRQVFTIIIVLVALAAIIVFLYFQTIGTERRLIGLLGPILFIAFGYIFSTNRKAINWRLIVTGITSQFVLGVICIRWDVGRNIFDCIGNKIVTFLNYSVVGSRFVFGDEIVDNGVFAFAILPVIFFFSFSISILYYLGTMQWVLMKMGWILQTLLGTTVCESVNGAANIFLGMTESPLLIRPYIKYLTTSELHAIMTSGFATVSGTVLAAYVSFGASPALLVTSSVMAAPASLAMAKLYFPETEESKTQSNNIQLEKSEDTSVLDAASNGAQTAISIILGIIANLVAFVAFIAFLNGVIAWLGYLVGLDEITFEWIFSKLFIPLSYVLGVEWKDCDSVAKVIASKTIINEFVAYQKLGEFIKAGTITDRSASIATFAVCGFANPSSLGIMIGSLSALAPERRPQITSVALRSFVVGTVVCFTSASFAGLLMPDSMLK